MKIKIQLLIVFSLLCLFLCSTQLTTANEYQNPTAIIDTSKGTIKIELYLDKTPITVNNFVKLAEDGFYDSMIFHRISDDFMIQAGYIYLNGSTASSPYGPINLEIHENVRHIDGAISMARKSDPNSATSQFFICDGAQSFLDDNYAVFGVTIEGIDVVRDIADDDHDHSSPAGGGKPYEDIILNSITIEGYQEALANLIDPYNIVSDGTDDIIYYTKLEDDSLYNYYYLQSSKPDIDVKQIAFDIVDDKAVLNLTVSGSIVTDSELFAYHVTYYSSTTSYSFTYSNDTLSAFFIAPGIDDIGDENFTVNDDTITVTFNSNSSGSENIDLYGYAGEYTRANDTFVEHWLDYCPDGKGPTAIELPEPEEPNPSTSDEGPGFELILVLFTIALVYLIKKKK